MKTINIYDKKNRIQLINDVKNYFQSNNKSPFILKFYGAFFEKGSVNLIFEYMDRGTLLGELIEFANFQTLSKLTRKKKN